MGDRKENVLIGYHLNSNDKTAVRSLGSLVGQRWIYVYPLSLGEENLE